MYMCVETMTLCVYKYIFIYRSMRYCERCAHKRFEMAAANGEPTRNVIAVSARDIRAYVLYKKYTYVLYISMNK